MPDLFEAHGPYEISIYDIADEPGRDGTWRLFARRKTLRGVRAVLARLYGMAYGDPSIDIWDEGAQDWMEEKDWPIPEGVVVVKQ